MATSTETALLVLVIAADGKPALLPYSPACLPSSRWRFERPRPVGR